MDIFKGMCMRYCVYFVYSIFVFGFLNFSGFLGCLDVGARYFFVLEYCVFSVLFVFFWRCM